MEKYDDDFVRDLDKEDKRQEAAHKRNAANPYRHMKVVFHKTYGKSTKGAR